MKSWNQLHMELFKAIVEVEIRHILGKIHRVLSSKVTYVLLLKKKLYVCFLMPLIKLEGQLQELGC